MDGITNYFESLVLASIRRRLSGTAQFRDEEYIADVACVALNRLPARYVRHIVDTRFFESESESIRNQQNVDAAVEFAIAFISQRMGERPDGSSSRALSGIAV